MKTSSDVCFGDSKSRVGGHRPKALHFRLTRNVRHSSGVLAGVTASMGRIDFGRISMIFLAYGRFAA